VIAAAKQRNATIIGTKAGPTVGGKKTAIFKLIREWRNNF
jgi:hypothetical protein